MKEIREIVIEEINNYNRTAEEKVDLSEGDNSILFSEGSVLDSISFVGLILDIEQAVEDEIGKSISLSDAKALSQKRSPFRTVGSLVAYISDKMR